MKFNETLNQYMGQIGCTAKELAMESGLSPAVISRYRTGEREPEQESLVKLAAGLAHLALQDASNTMSEREILSMLQTALSEQDDSACINCINYNAIISALGINMKELSSATNFDASYLYRVRSGQRHPKDPVAFSESFCHFVTTRYCSTSDKEKIADLTGCTPESIRDSQSYHNHLVHWLYQGSSETTNDDIKNFLKKLDEFDLDSYIRAIHFDELKVPSVPFQMPTSRHYYGVSQMRKGELDFFKSTVLSKSMEPIFMCSDMPMDDMVKDMDFNKKWMFGIAMSLKKGLHLNMIHNIDRPFHELMLGLEAWIPIYMTGQISPYYLPDNSTKVYLHLTYVSGNAALTGECIHGHHDKGKYYFTNNKEEVGYYKQKATLLLAKAQPLMEIFREPSTELFRTFMHSAAEKAGTRHNILSAPPIYTLSTELLLQILTRNHVAEKDKEKLLTFVRAEKEMAEEILQKSLICDEIMELSLEEFEKHPMQLSLAGMFYDIDIPYTYEEYQKHLQLTAEYAVAHKNYTMKLSNEHAFRNIQIQMLDGDYVMISKMKSPVIHFVIRHPKLVHALENFIPPVVE